MVSGYRESGAIEDGVEPGGVDCEEPSPGADPDALDFASASLLLFSNAARNCCSSSSSRDNVSFCGLGCALGCAFWVDGSSFGDGVFDHQPMIYSV